MRSAVICIVFAFCFLFTSNLLSKNNVNTNIMLKVSDLKIDGHKNIKEREIRDVMQIKEGESYKSYILEYLIGSDEEIIKEFYRKKGYFNALVSVDMNYKKGDEVEVSVNIEEGECCKIVRVDIIGEMTDEERKRLWKQTDLDIGEEYSEDIVNASELDIFMYLAEQSYIYADVYTDVHLNEDKTECEIIFNVDRGHKAFFGDCAIKGLSEVDEEIVRREFLFKKGDPYKPSIVSETKSRIYRTGLFSDLDFKPLGYEGEPTYVDLLLVVREEKQQYLEVYPGYESPDRVKFGLGWGHNNFIGNNRQFSIGGDISYGFASKEDEENVNVSLFEPYLFGLRVVGRVGLYIQRVGKKTYEYLKLGSEFGVEKELTERVSVFETCDMARVWAKGDLEDSGLEEGPRYTTSLKTTLRYDSRDNPFNPLNGAYSYGSFEIAGWFLPGTDNFARAIIELNRYMPVKEGGLMALHLRLGDIEPVAGSKNIPIYERFFTGGAYSVRGFEQDGLGPLDDEGEPLGGRVLVTMGVDFRFRLPLLTDVKIPWIGLPLGNLWGAIFIDGGNVFEGYEYFKLERLRFGGGIGLRYNTPFGPIRFDIARPLDSAEDEREEGFIYYIALGHAY
ncbi:MAG: hypothetical protein B6D57_03885 [Candidatus Coatesbacteria bacterium 4484_99]|uniref:POTRA domain-containing protein n=1 Tax=Candidatus Coatesbacteria bacterium 4484_99 TaxID=1970774 RepID=A0A1W9S0Z2_9BACT|nr:MAG: hypothetical protein B6D57_03885 [Candidatus Coatesbacteria bacterium 4484_99]RLC40594.1 MAG: hypothetical protein DRH51_05165 [Candidatus Coatesbacteria bacterium]RLC41159.1 MAG: hypothetical protein DRH44_07730 [Candidatus Coatesbacteria bacterium]RLC43266.1 MAG: hypothetical protein DRH49_01725 [Candidatus Coatesbacteria bacterium]